MNLSNADYHDLAYSVRDYYISMRLERRRLIKRMRFVDEKIKELEDRHRIKSQEAA